jgi:amino acid transporter
MTSNAGERSGLREHCLNYVEVLGQSVANDGPSLAIATGVGLVALSAANGATIVFIAATVGIILVAINIGYCARRLASSGSLYEYVRRGLGTVPGFVTGWSQIAGYLGGAMFACIAIYVYLQAFLADLHVTMNGKGWAVLVVLVSAALATFLAFRSIRLSTRTELVLETASILVMSVLAVVILVKYGAHFDTSQFHTSHMNFHSLVLGFPLAILSFVGFESAASLGVEADRPHHSIPRAVIGTAVFIGLFFIILSYVQLAGFNHFHQNIAESPAPLNDLASAYGVGTLGTILSAGIVCSAFGIALACLNAASRIAFTMSKDSLFPSALGETHPEHQTPTAAVLIGGLLVAIVPSVLLLIGDDPIALLTDIGEVTALGLLVAYLLVCIAAPVYLYRVRALSPVSGVVGLLGTAAVAGMILGQVSPFPPAPLRGIIIGFAIFLVVGLVLVLARRGTWSSSIASSTTDEVADVAAP